VAEKRVQIVEIQKDEIHCVVPAGHPLSGAESVTCEALIPFPLLLPQSGMTRSRLNTWFEKVEDDLQISMELDSTETMKRFVKAGLGICFLAGSNCREDVAAGTLRSLPLAPEPMTRKLGLIYRKDKVLSKAALGFIQVVLGHFGSRNSPVRPPAPAVSAGTL
jgi:DNA-binding transcriptional LysR family regulator